MIIDFHTHLEFKSAEEYFSPEEFIAGMDEGGIEISCLYGNDQSNPGSCPEWRDSRFMAVPTNYSDKELAEFCSHYPNRLIGFTSIHPDRYQPERKVERAIKKYGLRAVKLYPHSGFYPNDPRLFMTYEFCSSNNIPVVIHTGPKAVRWQWMKYNQPIYVDDIATNFPDLKIVICHGGYPWTEEFIAVSYLNPNIWVDLTFMETIEKIFILPGYIENTLRRLSKMIGSRRLMWGSEGPFMNLPSYGTHDPSFYKESQFNLVKRFDFLTEDDKENILGNNAARLLGIINE